MSEWHIKVVWKKSEWVIVDAEDEGEARDKAIDECDRLGIPADSDFELVQEAL